ncbi:MAG: hypothetical protein AVDCRST_MAG72-793 [uncultured Nocardioidaceae bacterium]|uniref:Histidine kinase/HSP90-like ATPase domain-containing protein n=1 Tax=uncultured Nocardioidaceae bacterium TaxID=253824 RepID=A0A6J4LTF2_9ACTN|nr:MAG: hypothetical protein AVDCRST_MAG72-793 [uncultured Nocardioidaceae bacterium]
MTTPAKTGQQAPVKIRIPFAASSVSSTRERLQSWLAEQGRSAEGIEDARLVLSELIANSIRHAQPLPDGTILVTWCTRGQEFIVSVTDGGAPTTPRALAASRTALAGRGLAIIDSVAQRWWAEQTGSAATVHACLSVA